VISESVKEVLESDALAHVVTISGKGDPNVTLAWVGIEDDEIVLATLFDQRKLKNIRTNPRVAISVETDRVNPIGLNEYLVIHGTGRVTEGGAPELLQKLAYTYLGPDVKFPPMPDPPPGYVTRISVDRVAGVGPWAEGG
jgi:PPOX class probable F420-dependent enzyme